MCMDSFMSLAVFFVIDFPPQLVTAEQHFYWRKRSWLKGDPGSLDFNIK